VKLTGLASSLRNICITNDHGYVPLDVSTSRSFPRSCLITVFVTGVTRQVPLVVQELIILPEHLGSTLVFSGVRFARSLVFCVFFCRSLFIVLSFWIILYMYMYCGTWRVTPVTNTVMRHERGKDREVLTSRGTYPWSFVIQIFRSGQQSHGGDRTTFEAMISTCSGI
jgi:hypothetical protein